MRICPCSFIRSILLLTPILRKRIITNWYPDICSHSGAQSLIILLEKRNAIPIRLQENKEIQRTRKTTPIFFPQVTLNQMKSKRFAKLWTKVISFFLLLLLLHLLIFVFSGWIVEFSCFCRYLLYIHFRTKSLRGASKFFPFMQYIYTFLGIYSLWCIYYIIICFDIRVFFQVTASVNKNGEKYQAPNIKITEVLRDENLENV